jgi:hypothetical protein
VSERIARMPPARIVLGPPVVSAKGCREPDAVFSNRRTIAVGLVDEQAGLN